jgi:restriction system protein
MTRKKPTFEELRKSTRNGKEYDHLVIQGRVLRCNARTIQGRSTIDFDLFSGNHDLRKEDQDALWERFIDYRDAYKFRPTTHVHFSRTSIICQVRSEHVEEWFSLLWDTVSNVENLQRIRCEFLSSYAKETLGRVTACGIVLSGDKTADGDLVKVIAPAFKKITELLQFDYTILHSMDPRTFEELIAAAYSRLGFEKVVLTPRSGDQGRDLIIESRKSGAVRLFVEAKRYSDGNLVPAKEVRSLLGTMLGEPETTKGILVTTSDFAPEVRTAPNIARHLGKRLRLLNGTQLVEKLVQIEYSAEKPDFAFASFD